MSKRTQSNPTCSELVEPISGAAPAVRHAAHLNQNSFKTILSQSVGLKFRKKGPASCFRQKAAGRAYYALESILLRGSKRTSR
jgi:hypothetical protein